MKSTLSSMLTAVLTPKCHHVIKIDLELSDTKVRRKYFDKVASERKIFCFFTYGVWNARELWAIMYTDTYALQKFGGYSLG
jgi:hypothetical protein